MTDAVKSAVALGYFDGLHNGHKAVIACALSYKERGLNPVILLFDSHPLLTLTGKAPAEIQQSALRDRMLSEMGIRSEIISFESVCNYSPEEFFNEIIIGRLNAGAVCCGENYRFGKGGEGTCGTLKALCTEHNIVFSVSEMVKIDETAVSSTVIRSLISNGEIKKANEMLGYEFSYMGEVMHGAHRGHLIGSPTINQYFDKNFIIPKKGVYASVTIVNGREYGSVTNIGLRPTFENEDLRSETNILGFSGDLYGQIIEVRLIDYIRGEMKFDSSKELIARISLDSEISRQIFKERSDRNV